MSNTSISGMITIEAQNAPAWVLVAQSDQNVLSCYDEFMLSNSPYLVCQTHVAATGGHKLIKPIRVWQYGEGLITRGVVILSIDKEHREAYTAINTDTTDDGDLLIKQDFSGSLTGHQFDITFILSGTGINLRETVLEFAEVQ